MLETINNHIVLMELQLIIASQVAIVDILQILYIYVFNVIVLAKLVIILLNKK